jgi:23S rRNA maturation-related 3'-5' exoribonuclease YhaM
MSITADMIADLTRQIKERDEVILAHWIDMTEMRYQISQITPISQNLILEWAIMEDMREQLEATQQHLKTYLRRLKMIAHLYKMENTLEIMGVTGKRLVESYGNLKY